MRQKKERRGVLPGAVAALALLLFGLTGIIRLLAGDAEGMRRAMLRYAPPASAGLPEGAYAGVSEMLTGYLTDRVPVFQYALEREGVEIPCFGANEAAHMADVRGLIRLDTAVCLACLLLTAGAAAAAAVRNRGRGLAAWDGFFRGGRRALLALGILAAGIGIWAAADFEGLFITFHRVAFTNDLWLMDPRTDLLIRLMPETLFVHLGLRGLLWAAVWTLGSAAAVLLPGRRAARAAAGERERTEANIGT